MSIYNFAGKYLVWFGLVWFGFSSERNHAGSIHLACKMRSEREGVLSLGDAWQETSMDVGLLKKIVAGKKEFIGRN